MEDIFEAASCAQSLSAYLDALADKQDVLGLQIQALADSEFEAGLRALQQAGRSETETTFLVREARTRFNKALSLETGLRLAHTHVALAICHSNLGDGENASRSLVEILDVSIPPFAAAVHLAKTLGTAAGIGVMLTGPLGWLATGALAFGTGIYRANQAHNREALHAQQSQELEVLKEAVRSYLNLPSRHAAEGNSDGQVEARCPDCGLVNHIPAQPGRARVLCPRCSRYFGVDA